MHISKGGILWLFPEDLLSSVMMWNRDCQSTETFSIPHSVWVKTKTNQKMPHFQESYFYSTVFFSILYFETIILSELTQKLKCIISLKQDPTDI